MTRSCPLVNTKTISVTIDLHCLMRLVSREMLKSSDILPDVVGMPGYPYDSRDIMIVVRPKSVIRHSSKATEYVEVEKPKIVPFGF